VGVLDRYSNHAHQGKRLQQLLDLDLQRRPKPEIRTAKRVCRRLDEDEIAEIVSEYAAGVRVGDLAQRFEVDQVTVQKYVRLHGVPRRTHRIPPTRLDEVIESYLSGKSVAALAKQLEVGETTVRRALVRAEVPLRSRGRPKGHQGSKDT